MKQTIHNQKKDRTTEKRSFTEVSKLLNFISQDGGGLKTYTDLIIRVLDVQDTPPFFSQDSYATKIDEDIEKV